MWERIPKKHPLSRLFTALVERSFYEYIGLYDPSINFYLSHLLLEFIHVDNLYRIKDMQNRRLKDLGKIIRESDLLSRSWIKEKERGVRKYIGDYTLFFTGMFPESLKKRVGALYLDRVHDYIRTGKESYRIVAEFNYGEYRKEAPLFKRLAENFDVCVVGLNFVKKELDKMQQPDYLRIKRILH